MSQEKSRIKSFEKFYPYYQTTHVKRATKICHVVGTGSFLGLTCLAALKRSPRILSLGALAGYGCAWLGDMIVEHKVPATFKYPWWSLLANFKMFVNILLRKEKLGPPAAAKS